METKPPAAVVSPGAHYGQVLLGREINEDQPVGSKKLLGDYRLCSGFGHYFERPLELIGAVNQNWHDSKTGFHAFLAQVFNENFAITVVRGWRCRENRNTGKVRH
jgi:hypothetical protein